MSRKRWLYVTCIYSHIYLFRWSYTIIQKDRQESSLRECYSTELRSTYLVILRITGAFSLGSLLKPHHGRIINQLLPLLQRLHNHFLLQEHA